MAIPKYSMLTLLVGLTSFDAIQGFWLNEINCFLRSGVRIPRIRQLLSLDEFNEKIRNSTGYAYLGGTAPPNESKLFKKSEVTWQEGFSAGQLEFKYSYPRSSDNGCSTFIIDELESISDRAEFNSDTFGYVSVFSSDPDSYFWFVYCENPLDDSRMCPTETLFIELFTKEFAPSNLDFEMIGKDLRSRTCLTTAGDNGVFEFFWTQGENEGYIFSKTPANLPRGPQME